MNRVHDLLLATLHSKNDSTSIVPRHFTQILLNECVCQMYDYENKCQIGLLQRPKRHFGATEVFEVGETNR
jgi:hypothetical protein